MITTINLLIVGVGLFSYFAFTAPEDCPREYRTTRTHLLFEVCELDYGGKFVLKDNAGEK